VRYKPAVLRGEQAVFVRALPAYQETRFAKFVAGEMTAGRYREGACTLSAH